MDTKKLARSALIVALALALQSIRLVLPLPPMLSAFLIGCFVHTMLVVARRYAGLLTAVLLSLLLPCTAYAQGQLRLIILVPLVMAGNILFVYLVGVFTEGWKQYAIPAAAKAVFLSCAWTFCATKLVHIDVPALLLPVLFSMSVPQLVTGAVGVWSGEKLLKRLKL